MVPANNNSVIENRDSRRYFLQRLLLGTTALTATGGMPAIAWQSPEASPATPTAAGAAESVAQRLARFAQTLRYDDLPDEVIRVVKRTILDTVGCAIGGYQTIPSQIAVKLASGVSAKSGASVFCGGFKTSQELAAFANGVMIRNLDFNDAYTTPVGGGHPSDSLAALLASAEAAGRSGRDLIVAVALTYEIFCKISDVLDIKTLGLDQATVLGLAATVGAGRLMGLSPEQMVNSIGMIVGGNTAINQGRVGTLSNWKDYATAEAARKAIFSAQLAQAGMTGPAQIFEGPSGFFRVIAHKPFELPPLGEPFGILRAVTKRFPLGQYSQTVAEAALQMRSFFGNTDEIQEINLGVSHNAIRVMAGSADKWRPASHETADHSMPYAAAVVLMYGTIDDHYYEDPYLHDPRLLELVSKVHCTASAEADMHEKDYNMTDFEIVLKSGQRKSVRVDYHRGHWKNPMSDAELEAKFRSLAGRQLASKRVGALLDQLRNLENMPKAGGLLALTKI
ncbi:MAG TPA: MmgE/PrpD family protein [Steroidobacteraceae bacterium]|jgi:2-methylcitrate dehydratase